MTAADMLEEMCKGWSHNRSGQYTCNPSCHLCQVRAVIAKLWAEPALDREALIEFLKVLNLDIGARFSAREPSAWAWCEQFNVVTEVIDARIAALTHAKEARDGKA